MLSTLSAPHPWQAYGSWFLMLWSPFAQGVWLNLAWLESLLWFHRLIRIMMFGYVLEIFDWTWYQSDLRCNRNLASITHWIHVNRFTLASVCATLFNCSIVVSFTFRFLYFCLLFVPLLLWLWFWAIHLDRTLAIAKVLVKFSISYLFCLIFERFICFGFVWHTFDYISLD